LYFFFQNLSGRKRRPFLQRRPSKQRKQLPILPTVNTQSEEEEDIFQQEDVQPLEDVRFKIPLDKEIEEENELNLEEQLFANILQNGQIKQESTKSFRGRQRQPINTANVLQRTQRPKSSFITRNRNTSSPRKSTTRKLSTNKSRTTSSAINDPALRNRQRSRTRLRTRPNGGSTSSNNRIHPFSTTTNAPIPITTTTQEFSTTRFELQTTFDLDNFFPTISTDAPEPPAEIEPREQFPDQPVQNTFVTRARAPVERLLPTTPRTNAPIERLIPTAPRARRPVDRVRPTTTSSPVTEIEYNDYYEYYDEEKQAPSIAHPKPLKSIDDYDLFPLNNKV
jgi:hypothetical protein